MRKLKLFFACLLMAVLSIGQMWGAETQFSWAGSSTADGGATDYVVTVSPITLTFAKGSNNNAPRTNKEGAVRMYTGTTLTISSSASNITRVVFTPTTNSYQATNLTYNSVALTGNDWTLETPAASVTLTATANARFKTIVVHTADGSDPVAVTGVTLDQSVAEVAVGKTITLVPTVAPTNATNKAVSWESSDDDVATVANGVVTGVAEGSATITVKTTDGNKTATCAITVTPAPAAVNYEKVTAEPADWSGEYLLVYEADATNARVWKGADQANYYAEAAISNGVIAAPDDAAVLTIAKVAESDPVVYTIMVGDKYIGQTSNSNGIKIQDAAINNSLSMESNGVGIVASEAHLRYNSASSSYFRYYKSSTYSSQNPIQLYKKVDGTVKPSAELSYAAVDQKKLVKLGDAFTAPTLANPNNLTGITYASSDATVVEVNSSTGAIVEIKKAGVVVITASRAEDDTYKAGSASYTIGVTAHAGTQADPYTVADAKIVIDAIETEENVHVAGKVSQIVTAFNSTYGNISFNISEDGTTANQLEAFRCKSFGGAAFTSENDVETGATVVVKGILKKYNSKYELDENCCLVTYEAPAAPKTPIANTQETAYSVAQALVYAADGLIYDLNDEVFVQGKVAVASNNLYSDKYLTYFISDNGVNENTLKIYNGLDINGASFTSKDDVKVGDIVIVKGKLLEYNSVLELNQNNELVLHKPVATISVENMEIAVSDEPKAIVAEIIPAMAADHVVYSIAEGGDAFISIDAENKISAIAEGVATVNVTLADGDTYAGTNASFTVTVNAAAAPVLTNYYEKVTSTADIVEGTYLIVYEGENVAFDGGLDDSDNDHKLDKASNTIAVDITTDHKIGVTSATEAATFYIDPTAGTIQSASGKYIGVTSNSNGLKTSDNASAYNNSFAIDGDGNAIIGAVFSESTMTLRYNTDSGQKRFRYYKTTGSPAGQLYKLANEVTKLNPELAWDKESIELTVGGLFISPELSHAQGITGTISYVSDNENVATVENGVISLVAEATGTAHITASYAGDENYKSGSAVCTIKVNPAHSIYVDKLNVNFGSVTKEATVDDQVITVTLTEVPNATATLGGSGASAFSIDPAALTASGNITISASSATAGTFNATLTISDDAGLATSKVVNLSITVVDPATVETAISTSTKWVAAVAADLVDGAEVLITGVKDAVTYAMGEQKSTNRAAYVATIDGEGVLTPGEGTMAFTLVAQEAEGVFALRTSNGKYLYAAKNDANHLKTQDEVDVNAKWTLTVASAVAEGSSNRNVMQFNGSGTNKLFSCYASANQSAIQLYVPKPVTPPTPVYTTIRDELTPGNYYTICYPKSMTDVQGATLWSFVGKDANLAYIQQETAATIEAGKPYIMYATASTVTAVLGDETNAPGANGAIHGTFEKMFQADLDVAGDNIYLIIGNELRQVDGQNGNTLPAYRAYIDLDEIGSAPANMPAHVRSMPLHKDTTTGVENAEASEKPVKLLINGQIFILRGEKMYDATGRLVK